METEELLKHLRECAKNAEGYQCQEATKKLFSLLEMRDVLQITLVPVYAHLPEFERRHPEKTWLRQWLDLASSLVPVIWSRDAGFEFYHYFDDQSSNDYIEGIGLLRDAFYAYFKHRKEIVVDLSAGAIGYVGVASLFTYLTGKAPFILLQYEETFKQDADFSQEEKFRRLIAFREDPDRRYFIDTFWSQIADNIERRLFKL